MITDTILNVLGITTTTTPAPCGLGSGLIGLGLLSPCEETTTATTGETTTTTAEETTTTAAEETTTTAAEETTTPGGEETTTAGETTTTAAPCGGILGLGLLAEPGATDAAETTTGNHNNCCSLRWNSWSRSTS